MSEERLQEIKDSVEFQYKLAKVKCIDNALLFADEERELIEEIERLNKENKLLQDMDKILRNENTNLKLEIERLNNIIKEIYIKANNTNITSLDLREYILDKLGCESNE